MKRVLLPAVLLICTASLASAQTEGKVSVGASVTLVRPTSDGVDSSIGIGPLVLAWSARETGSYATAFYSLAALLALLMVAALAVRVPAGAEKRIASYA